MNELNRKLNKIIRQDSVFLISHGFLDYSLLLAVEKSESESVDLQRTSQNRLLTRGLVKIKQGQAKIHRNTAAKRDIKSTSFSADETSEDNPGLKKYPSTRYDIAKVGKSDSLVKFKFSEHLTVPDAASNIAPTHQPSSLESS